MTTYFNRYGDKITFEENEDTVTMSGYNPEWMRYGFGDDPTVVNMVDPSGGPYINVGSDLRYFFEDGRKRVVESISLGDNCVKFKIAT